VDLSSETKSLYQLLSLISKKVSLCRLLSLCNLIWFLFWLMTNSATAGPKPRWERMRVNESRLYNCSNLNWGNIVPSSLSWGSQGTISHWIWASNQFEDKFYAFKSYNSWKDHNDNDTSNVREKVWEKDNIIKFAT